MKLLLECVCAYMLTYWLCYRMGGVQMIQPQQNSWFPAIYFCLRIIISILKSILMYMVYKKVHVSFKHLVHKYIFKSDGSEIKVKFQGE